MIRSKPIPKKRSKPRRVSVVRDQGYLDWLKLQRCSICGWMQPWVVIDPAHGPVNGISSKGGDDGAIPLCRSHHREQHSIGWPAFEKKYGIDRGSVAAARYAHYIHHFPND